jgi:hypothetical protein
MERGVSGMIRGRILLFLLNTDHFYPRIYEGTLHANYSFKKREKYLPSN